MKQHLKNFTRDALKSSLAEMGEKPFRADQVFRFLYKRDAASFEEMSTLKKDLRAALAERFLLDRGRIVETHLSEDGTRKFLVELGRGARVESVLIPEPDRLTICISTQVGCSLNCRFCRTGTMDRERNLEAWEILEQVQAVARAHPDRPIKNVVFMGMGEPLLNYDAVVSAARVMLDDLGLCLSTRRVTISTAGIVPAIKRLGADIEIGLAISLHAADDETRTRIMPVNKKYHLADILAACREFPLRNRRRITYEYIMLAGVNDSDDDAHKLRDLMSPLKAHVNLIYFNSWDGCPFAPSSEERVRAFQRILLNGRVNTVVRKSRGRDILAACGQLKSKRDL